jgi:hypothetical protein
LREALAAANDGDEITFATTGTITLTSGELLVDKSITISGPGANNLAVEGDAKSRIFHIDPDATVTLSDLTVTNGYAGCSGIGGDGIYNDHRTLMPTPRPRPTPAPRPQGNPNFIGSYFSNNNGLCIVTSTDGINLKTLYKDCYIPSTGVFRDPSIVRWNDTWYVAYTARYPYSVWGACNFFGLIKSTDLQNWTFIRNISTLQGGTQTWAPEWFVDTDGSLHLFVSLSNNNYEWGGTIRIYEMHPTDNSFLNWSSPAITPINNNGSLITNNYDPQVIFLNGSYNMLFTDGGGARCGVSANLLGPYDTNGVGYIIPNNSRYGSEGMNAFPVDDTWRMIVDATSGGTSRQLYTTWTPGASFLSGWSNYTEITLDGAPAVGLHAYHHGTLFKLPDSS